MLAAGDAVGVGGMTQMSMWLPSADDLPQSSLGETLLLPPPAADLLPFRLENGENPADADESFPVVLLARIIFDKVDLAQPRLTVGSDVNEVDRKSRHKINKISLIKSKELKEMELCKYIWNERPVLDELECGG